MNRYDDFKKNKEPNSGCRGIIFSLFIGALLWIGIIIFLKAYAYDNTEPDPKEHCYSFVSGQSMPMEYCDGW